ncbi:MAG TPA: ADOP family duplicated permease [Vicinamibacterales bacterium]|nr:ADOP family duplicated permease [Vicinamibacterales bacterium]
MHVIRDVRYALRILGRNKAFAAAALVVVALGIGATTAVFTVVHAVLLRSLPYRDVDRLVVFRVSGPAIVRAAALTPEEFLALRQRTDNFDEVATVNAAQGTLTGVGNMEVVTAAMISDNYLSLVGATAVIGRQVNAREDMGEPYIRAVDIGYEFWQRRWHGDPGLVGRHIEVNNIDVVVAGVMPRGFRAYLGPGADLPEQVDVWFPGAPDFGPQSRNAPVIARLRNGVSRGAAQRAIDTWLRQFVAAHAASYRLGPVSMTLVPLADDVVSGVKPALVALAGAVGFVLLVACANLTNLLLARASARQRELAVRRAIGASRAAVVRQLATESVVLWTLGASAGLVCAQFAVWMLLALAPASLPRRDQIVVDFGVAAFTLLLSFGCALVFGLLPAWQATRDAAGSALKQNVAAPPGSAPLRGLLLSSQLALSLMLLVGAGLLVRAFVRLGAVPLGFTASHVVTMTVDVRALSPETTAAERLQFYNAVAEAVRHLPGVESAAFGLPIPLNGTLIGQRFATAADAPEQVATQFIALPGYAETLALAVREGRTFTAADNTRADPGILVDERLARTIWPGRRAVGQRLLLGPGTGPRTWAEVIGVVAHVQATTLRGGGEPQIWVTHPTRLFFQMGLAVRTTGDPRALTPVIRQTVERLGPRRPVAAIRTLDEIVAGASADTRFALFVLGVFATIALVLTVVGVYGVAAYAVARRRREIAVRVALGASARDIVALVVREGVLWSIAGVGAGIAGARLVAGSLESLLFQIRATDRDTFAAVALLLTAVALGASLVPALRATRTDPMLALRAE